LVVAEVKIELKDGVSDPEGANTQKALELLGFSGIERVRSVRVFEITLSESGGDQKEAVEEMCRRLLANPVIHRYSIEFK